MNDPHVEELIYRMKPEDGVTFEDPPPIEDETDDFSMTLENGIVTFSMKEHHPTEHSARQAVEKYLRSWELDVALRNGRSQLHFDFDRSSIVDRNPPPSGTPAALSGKAVIEVEAEAAVRAPMRAYPQPPRDFVADPDTDVLWRLYDGYKEGRDRLLPMAFSCLSRLKYRAYPPAKGNTITEETASMYRVDEPVLDKLSDLASTLGDEVEARKIVKESQFRPPTDQEVRWIEAALRLLIRRAGQYAADPYRAWPELTLDDLPDLDSG